MPSHVARYLRIADTAIAQNLALGPGVTKATNAEVIKGALEPHLMGDASISQPDIVRAVREAIAAAHTKYPDAAVAATRTNPAKALTLGAQAAGPSAGPAAAASQWGVWPKLGLGVAGATALGAGGYAMHRAAKSAANRTRNNMLAAGGIGAAGLGGLAAYRKHQQG